MPVKAFTLSFYVFDATLGLVLAIFLTLALCIKSKPTVFILGITSAHVSFLKVCLGSVVTWILSRSPALLDSKMICFCIHVDAGKLLFTNLAMICAMSAFLAGKQEKARGPRRNEQTADADLKKKTIDIGEIWQPEKKDRQPKRS